MILVNQVAQPGVLGAPLPTCRRSCGHYPEPLERMGEQPGGFVDVVDRSLARLCRNGGVMRLDGFGHPVEHLLDGSQADGYLQHGGTKALYHAAAIAIGPSQFTHEGTEPW